MLSGMPSRRLAESPRLWISLVLAAGVSTALVAIRRDPPPPPPPEPEITICAIPDVTPRCATPRADDVTTASGIRIVTLHDGCGSGTPAADDVAQVRFAGWNARGESIVAEETGSFPLTAVIPGFTEVVRGMRVGDKVRAWIPGPLAYDNRGLRDPKIAGTLMFEIELISFRPPR